MVADRDQCRRMIANRFPHHWKVARNDRTFERHCFQDRSRQALDSRWHSNDICSHDQVGNIVARSQKANRCVEIGRAHLATELFRRTTLPTRHEHDRFTSSIMEDSGGVNEDIKTLLMLLTCDREHDAGVPVKPIRRANSLASCRRWLAQTVASTRTRNDLNTVAPDVHSPRHVVGDRRGDRVEPDNRSSSDHVDTLCQPNLDPTDGRVPDLGF